MLWAVPDYRAHATGTFVPNDPGLGSAPTDWEQLQWNFVGSFGVNAPEAWANVAADGAPGGRGVIVAVLDTGVAYANRGHFRRSPDFSRYEFVRGYDFVDNNPFPNDRNGHGTFVAATIAEATNNRLGLTGLAYGARLMPVRVLNSQGEGDASTIAAGVRFAVRHGARVINLSLEFSSEVTASDIPELIEALRFARRRGVVVVAAAGNEGHAAIAYPARAPDVIAVGATTEHGCLANYSNDGSGLTLVAPGGGADADLPGDPNCHPELPSGQDIYQMTFTGSSPAPLRVPSRLRRHLDGLPPRHSDRRADHRKRRARPPSVRPAGRRAAARDRAPARRARGLAAVWRRAGQRGGGHRARGAGGRAVADRIVYPRGSSRKAAPTGRRSMMHTSSLGDRRASAGGRRKALRSFLSRALPPYISAG